MTNPFVVERSARLVRPPALAPFASHLDDADVTDIFVNGDTGLFVDRGSGALRDPKWQASERQVRELATALIAAGGRHIDDAHPCVDVRLVGGMRVHAILAPVSSRGTAISIRVPRLDRPGLAELAEGGMFPVGIELALREAVRRRANFLISGATGSGKTTLLAALLSEAPLTERLVTIEDVAELVLEHPHHISLESRQANLEGAGAVGLAMLVREALRMKPDRLIVGECRGAEVRELLSALNTGHDGGAGTVHANGIADVPARLEALGALAGLDDIALARQVTSAIEFVAHLEQGRDGQRRVAALARFVIVDGRLAVEPWAFPGESEQQGRDQDSGGDDARVDLVRIRGKSDARGDGPTQSTQQATEASARSALAEHVANGRSARRAVHSALWGGAGEVAPGADERGLHPDAGPVTGLETTAGAGAAGHGGGVVVAKVGGVGSLGGLGDAAAGTDHRGEHSVQGVQGHEGDRGEEGDQGDQGDEGVQGERCGPDSYDRPADRGHPAGQADASAAFDVLLRGLTAPSAIGEQPAGPGESRGSWSRRSDETARFVPAPRVAKAQGTREAA